MNLILIDPAELGEEGRVCLTDRRFEHIRSVHKANPGDTLRMGVLGGEVGVAQVLQMDDRQVLLQMALDTLQKAPERLPVTLILALPRPKMMKRTLQTVAAMGVKHVWLINSYRVDKSYWSTPLLQPEAIREQLLLGLEQAGDTIMPEVHLRKRFKPFVEDELPAIAQNTRALVAHPYHAQPCPMAELTPTTLAVGPEGGFITYEVEKLAESGFQPISLGSRILRVETAIPVVLARLFPLQ
ncbi:16S rRNA (uracil(1498)-N(3))-methyltransferase [Nitrincola alkalilacustris]|uniref:16S rRNA (uracil(1498)-N(3))-methyltransferase n=1 Tax=Nitrincola alkalilacustris TaxID=1571224 RepID=UPI00124CEE03|nr:16S rRNA (uracil(1498)-N(3))-methyltransferase [Nitrincola alkalilacustris]